ncbi:MAG: hypothetical protein JXA69_00595 [Phycisphaerae bacterium]|nr:hypothetical protein [Phycisphaerae bacterium]
MIQCKDCEYFIVGPDGGIGFSCNPFTNIKEPECLTKWQLIKIDAQLTKIDTMVRAYQATLEIYKRLAPLQEKMFRHVEREIDETEETDSWKYEYDDDDEHSDEEERP